VSKKPLVSLEDVTVRFEEVTALSDVNLEITVGFSTAFIGPNGGGKTTLLKVIAGLINRRRVRSTGAFR
jgi:ABC-type Mn2+/Zn2+ transport system ATPase subunit